MLFVLILYHNNCHSIIHLHHALPHASLKREKEEVKKNLDIYKRKTPIASRQDMNHFGVIDGYGMKLDIPETPRAIS
jgi:hypothetical protein